MTPPSDDLDGLPLDAAEEAVLAALAERGAAPPPPAVRDRVLQHVARSPRPTVAAIAPSELYAARVAALAELLAEFGPADVTDYCRVVARRIEPHDLRATIEGERDLVDALLEASRVFAV